MSGFDPKERRETLLARALDLHLAIAYSPPFAFAACHDVGTVIVSIIVGLGDDPRVIALRDKAATGLAEALAASESWGTERLHDRAEHRVALGVARWMTTGQIERQLFVDAAADLETLIANPNQRMNNSRPPRMLTRKELVKGRPSLVDQIMLDACIGGDHARAIACYDAHVSAPSGGSVRDFAIQVARGGPDLAASADRMLNTQVGYALENHGPIDAVLQLYLGYVAIGREPTTPDDLIQRAVHHVKYLKPRTPKPSKPIVPAPPPTRPPATHPLPGPSVTDTSLRAALDGAGLSALASSPTAVPLEVCCARHTWNALAGVPIKVGAPLGKRKDWKEALAVGALVSLRALSIRIDEAPRARIARGTEPLELGPDWFWASPLVQQLEVLDVYVEDSEHELARWLVFLTTCSRLQAINVRTVSSVAGTPTKQHHHSAVSFVLARNTLTVQTSWAHADDDVLATSRPYLENFPRMPVVLEYVAERAATTTTLHRFLETSIGPVEVRGPCEYVEI